MSIESIRELKRTLKQRMKDEGGSALLKLACESMEKDDVAAMRWRQYTPHFNDGEPCLFGLDQLEVSLDPSLEEFVETRNCWDSESKTYEKTYPNCLAFEEVLDELKEISQITWGDGVEIIITREGKVIVEDYDHD